MRSTERCAIKPRSAGDLHVRRHKHIMPPFTASLAAIESDFVARSIPVNHPGFYDHPNFMQVERDNPAYLNNYARYVDARPRSVEYEAHVRKVAPVIAEHFYQKLLANGRLGACVDISGLVSRALEREGIWNFAVKGSLTMTFPSKSNIPPQYFYSIDQGSFTAGHAWVAAPPLFIIDVAIRLQPFQYTQANYLPPIVCSDSNTLALGNAIDIVAPEIRAHFAAHGVSEKNLLRTISPQTVPFLKTFPARLIKSGDVSLKYVPVAVGAPDVPFEEMKVMYFDGKTGYEVYRDEIAAKLRANDA